MNDTTSELRPELRKTIMYELDNMDSANKTETLDAILALLAAQRRRWEVAARINELRLACENWEQNPTLPATYMIDRIATLDGERGKEQ